MAGQVIEASKPAPPGVREVLVERHLSGQIRVRHHPRWFIAHERQGRISAEPMVNVSADAQREVDLLWLKSQDLAAQDLDRGLVVGRGWAQECVIALVAAVYRIGQVKIDQGGFGEVRVALVLGLAEGGRISVFEVDARQGPLRRDVVTKRAILGGLVADVGAAGPTGALPELTGLGIGALLGDLEPTRVCLPRRGGHAGNWIFSRDVGAIEGLAVGGQGLGAEARGLALVVGHARVFTARVDGQDGDRLAQLTQAGDQPATGQRDIVWMR